MLLAVLPHSPAMRHKKLRTKLTFTGCYLRRILPGWLFWKMRVVRKKSQTKVDASKAPGIVVFFAHPCVGQTDSHDTIAVGGVEPTAPHISCSANLTVDLLVGMVTLKDGRVAVVSWRRNFSKVWLNSCSPPYSFSTGSLWFQTTIVGLPKLALS